MKISKIYGNKITLEADGVDMLTLFVRAYHQIKPLSKNNSNKLLQKKFIEDLEQYQTIISELKQIIEI